MRNSTPTHRSHLTAKLNNAVSNTNARNLFIAFVLVTALLAFEMFNFDTTRYALNSLLGDVTFAGLGWATILAVAFCAIDFAGLARLFTPEKGADEPKEVWYLMGAWLLGATMNAVMTWWAVSLTLLNHELGNEVLTREQLLQMVPIFVAVLVWLTRILFIGSLTMAGEHFFDLHAEKSVRTERRTASAVPALAPQRSTSTPRPAPRTNSRRPVPAASFSPAPKPTPAPAPAPVRQAPKTTPKPTSRVRRRPPVPAMRPGMPVGMQAKGKRQ